MNKIERAKKIHRAIEVTYESLQSHLPWCYDKIEGWAKKRGESAAFHQKCVREYADIIKTLSELY